MSIKRPVPSHLFFYGVLLGDIASPAIGQLLGGIGPGRRAVANGTLHAVGTARGWYPVLLPGTGEVRGMVHETRAVNLAALDLFEGVDPRSPRAGEYRRQPIRVMPDDRSAALRADAYVYNLDVAPAFIPVPHGDFARWLRETGNPPLSN